MSERRFWGLRPVLVVVAFGLLVATCTEDGRSRPSPGDAIGSPSATSTAAEAPLQFVLQDRFEVGEKIRVRLRSGGRRPYVYNIAYEACDMRYFDESGRRFIIPPGTHCDIIANRTIQPGETVTLFKWRLEECVRDRWGCIKAEPLEPGTYRIVGRFPPGKIKNGVGTPTGRPVRVEAVFEIAANKNADGSLDSSAGNRSARRQAFRISAVRAVFFWDH
jgi:hypothetical protein